MRRLIPLLVLLFAGLAGCAAPDTCALVPLATMTIETWQNLMFVTAGIGGHPVRLLVDTGAQRTVLTQAAVARLGLSHDTSHITRSFGIGQVSANWDAVVPDIVLGHTRFPIGHVTVGDFSVAPVGGPAADGYLGADILLAFDMDIDEEAGRLTLYRVRRCADAAPPWRQPAVKIDGVEARRDWLLVPITLDGVAGMAILDTGAQVTTIGAAMARRLGLSAAVLTTNRTIMTHGAAPRPLAMHVHQFRELLVGDARIEAPILAVAPNGAIFGDALLGGDFLRNRRVWLSFATRRLFISSNGAPQFALDRR